MDGRRGVYSAPLGSGSCANGLLDGGVGIKEVWYSLSIWCHEMQESDRITWAYKTIIPIFMATNATYQGYVWGSTSGGVCGLLHKCLFNLLLDT